MLDLSLGVYNRPNDYVHLGMYGIRKLAKLFKEAILTKGKIDGRLFSSVLCDDNVGHLRHALS